MKNVHTAIVKAVALIAMVSASGFASAGDTQNLTVTASVLGTCKFTSAAQTLTFGSLDPSGSTATTAGAGAAVTYKCTKGTAATSVTAGAGLHNSSGLRMSNGTDFIPYTLTISGDKQTGDGFGAGSTDKALGVAGSVALADYQNVSAGSYSDTVLLTLAP